MQDAKELRPILIDEASHGLDLLLRDRLRKAYVLSRANMQPRLPFIGTLPAPAPPPVPVPGKGFVPLDMFVDTFLPKLSDEQEVLLDTQLELVGVILGANPEDMGRFDLQTIPQMMLNPTEQIRELRRTLAIVLASTADSQVVQTSAMEIASRVACSLASRADVPVSTLFPFLPDAWTVGAAMEGETELHDTNVSAIESQAAVHVTFRPQMTAAKGADTAGAQAHGEWPPGSSPEKAGQDGVYVEKSASTAAGTVVVNRSSPVRMVQLS